MKKLKIFLVLILLALFHPGFVTDIGIKDSLNLSIEGSIPPNANIEVRFTPQLPDYCGEACYVMALETFGMNVTQHDVHKASGLKLKRGCYSDDLYRAGKNLGIDADSYWIEGFSSLEERNYYLDTLRYFISLGYPVVISWNENPEDHDFRSFEHFVLAVGYDDDEREMTVMDPYMGPDTGRIFTYEDFLDHWQWRYKSGDYGLVMHVIKGIAGGVGEE